MKLMRKYLRMAIPWLTIGAAVALLVASKPWEPVRTIPAGTTLVAALEEDVSDEDTEVGDEFDLVTVRAIQLAKGVEIPEGTKVTGLVTEIYGDAESGAPSEIAIRFTELEIADQEYSISTEQYHYATLRMPARPGDEAVFSTGHPLSIRLSRPVSIRSHPAPNQSASRTD